jgi:hypothetical protein
MRALAQEETTRGKISGLVKKEDGGPVADARVDITSAQHDTHFQLSTDANGHYETTWLQEGLYEVRIEGRNFLVDRFFADVVIGKVTNGDRTLTAINPGPPSILSKVDPQVTGTLPLDGRDALNVAKFEPEILPEDAGRLAATKAGSFGLAIDKISGLDSRYRLDGVDLNDETHGGITQNIALGSVSELTITRGMRDASTGPTSGGAVLMATRQGSAGGYHGEVYGLFRDSALGFAAFNGRQDPHYQRSDFGGRVGGALLSNKLFFFVDAERVHQDSRQAVVVPAPFHALTGGFSSPYRNTSGSGRLDWNFSAETHAFYRFAYNLNSMVDNFGQGYAAYDNRSHSPSHAVGVDYTRGVFVHSFRFGYLHYSNSLQDATQRPDVLGLPGINLRFSDLNGGAIQFGANSLAPQTTLQNNIEGRYDAVRNNPVHTIRFGVSVNRITGGGYENPYGLAPQLTSAVGSGTDTNPLHYPLLSAILSDGQQFVTERSGFGFPHGGQADTQLQGYLSGAFRLHPNLTLTWGVHYVRDSGRTNSDLSPVRCSEIVAALPSVTLPCSGGGILLDQFGPGLGSTVGNPSFNFGPQFGVAWDPYRNGRTVIRGGAGWFYDTSLFSNVGLDRQTRLAQGGYAAQNVLTCAPGAAPGTEGIYLPTASGFSQFENTIGGFDIASQICGQPINTVTGAITALQNEYQQAIAALNGANPYFVGRTLAISNAANGLAAFESNYRSPRTYQMNVGIQREGWRGGVVTADYVRNVSQRFLMIQDNNHVGDKNDLQESGSGVPNAALNAITNAAMQKAPACLNNVSLPISAGAISQAVVNCYVQNVPGASINDFAVNGLDSGTAFLSGLPISIARGLTPALGAAFPGVNPLVGQGSFLASVGQAVYDGLQVGLKQNLSEPWFAFRTESFQISYTLSKYVSSGSDNPSGSTLGRDFRQAALFKGPSPLDRRHQFSFAGQLDSRWGPRLLLAGRFSSPAPTVLTLAPPTGVPQTTPGEIFRSDFIGDGSTGDVFPPKVNAGSFDPPGNAGSVYNAISKYNATQAGTVTPAGQALIDAQVVSAFQLAALHGTRPYLALPPSNQVSNPWFKSLDTAITWPLRLRESIIIEPRVSFYNILNFSNFAPLSGQLSYYYPGAGQTPLGAVGSANGTPSGAARDVLRVGAGTGVYNAGAPRQMEFGVKLTF